MNMTSSSDQAWYAPFTRPGPVLFATLNAVDGVARGIIIPVIPLEALHLLGSARNVSAAVTVVGVSGVCMALLLPGVIHLLRPRASYLLMIALMSVASLLMAFQHIIPFGLGWMMRTIAAAALLGLISIYIATFIDKRLLAKSEPIRTFFYAAAWTMGPFIGIRLYNYSSSLPFLVAAMLSLILFIYFRLLNLQAPTPAMALGGFAPVQSIKRYFKQKRLVLAWVLNFGRQMWWVTFLIYTPIYLVQAGRARVEAGNLIATCTSLLFISLFLGWLGRRIGLRRFISAAFLWVAIATFAMVWFSDQPDTACVMLIIAALGSAALESVCNVTFLRAVRSHERAEMSMIFSIYRDSAALIPPALFSLLLTFFPLPVVFFVNGCFGLICAILALKLPRGL